jgi:(1->4)-alpha-D-glucan 1-alpha-D-glucosylmutase
VDGVRVDHVDGLRDPAGYLRKLRRLVGASRYLVVEKILAEEETLPVEWRVDGTTGYDFLNLLNGLFVDPRGVRKLDRVTRRFTYERIDFPDLVTRSKRKVIDAHFRAELNALAGRLWMLAAGGSRGRAPSYAGLKEALAEVTVHLQVYRTYALRGRVLPRDRARIIHALREAGRNGSIEPLALRLLKDVMLGPQSRTQRPAGWRRLREEFQARWQQWTGAVMAKGFEDTALYAFPRLLSMNEVGGHPDGEGVEPAAFFRTLRARSSTFPLTMLATETHDTKRGEDVRARVNLLSELPEEWARLLDHWRRTNQRHRSRVDGQSVPSAGEEIFLYQTLLGAWPLRRGEMPAFRRRIGRYVVKAAREAMTNTSWIDPDTRHERALVRFAGSILADSEGFVRSFGSYAERVARCGAVNSLSQLLLKLVSPGIPDVYQGSELWDLRLVDPDNRGPVDYERRRRLLREIDRRYRHDPANALADLRTGWKDGRIKLFLLWRVLQVRRQYPRLFDEGQVVAITARGRGAERACAFARRHGGQWALAVVPRLVAPFVSRSEAHVSGRAWHGSMLALPPSVPRRWTNVLTQEPLEAVGAGRRRALSVSALLASFPVALLINRD